MSDPTRGAYDQTVGINSPIMGRETQAWLALRQRMYQDMAQQVGLAQPKQQLSAVDVYQMMRDYQAGMQPRPPHVDAQDYVKAPVAPDTANVTDDTQHLIQAARFYGVQNPETMTPQELQARVNAGRAGAGSAAAAEIAKFGASVPFAAGVARSIGDFVTEHADMAAKVSGFDTIAPFAAALANKLGIAQGVTGDDLKRITRDTAPLQEALTALDTGARMTLPADQQGLYNLAHGTGKLVGFSAVTWPMFEAVGVASGLPLVARYGSTLSPIARMAVQGGVAGGLLDVGTDKPWSQVALDAAQGGAFGAALGAGGKLLDAFAPQIASAAARIRARFLTPQELKGASGLVPQTTTMADQFEQFAANENLDAGTREQYAALASELRRQGNTAAPVVGLTPEPSAATTANAPSVAPVNALSTLTPEKTALLNSASTMYDVMRPSSVSRESLLNMLSSVDEPGTQQQILRQYFGEDGATQVLRGATPVAPPAPSMQASPDEGAIAGAQLTKQSMVMQSPRMAQVANQTVVNDADVAAAAVAGNPGGTNVVPNVTPQDVVSGLQQRLGTLSDGTAYRFARNPNTGKLDMIVGDSRAVTDARVEEYQRAGVYKGQTVSAILPGGSVRQAQVLEVGPFQSRVKAGNLTFMHDNASLLPSAQSVPVRDAPGVYDAFRSYVRSRFQAANEAVAGAAPVPDWLDQRTSVQLPQLMQDFFDDVGISKPQDQHALSQYFAEQRVADFAQQAPPEARAALASVNGALEATADAPIPPTLSDAAVGKGFVWARHENRAGGMLVDQLTGDELHFVDEQSAASFLRTVNREYPDYTWPGTNVPAEVMQHVPQDSPYDPKLNGDQTIDRVAEEAVSAARSQIKMENDALVANANGGRKPPEDSGGPGTGGGSTGGGGAEPPVASGAGDIGGDEPAGLRAEMSRLAADQNLGKLMDTYNGFVAKHWRPMRARFAIVESRLQQLGYDLIRPFRDFEGIARGIDVAHNEAGPWHDRWSGIMRKFPRAAMRDGTVTRIYEILDPAERAAEAAKAGLTPEHLELMDQMDQFFRDIFPSTELDPSREIKRYISHVAQRQGLGVSGDAAFQPYGPVSPAVADFWEHAREGNLDMREMDPRVLGAYYVRSLFFKKHVADAWEAAATNWNTIAKDPVLQPMAQVFQDWMKLVRRGYQPGPDVMLDAVHAAMNFFVPMSKREALSIMNVGLTNNYRFFLGFNPAAIARDSIQPLLSVPRVGTELFSVMKEYATGGADARAAMFQRGLERGWIHRGVPRLEAAGPFESPLASSPAPGAPELESARRAAAQQVGDIVHDMTNGLGTGITGTPLDPLFFYTKLGERNRMFTGEAAYRVASREIQAMRSGQQSLDDVLSSNVVAPFEPAVKRRFEELVRAGMDDDAASFIGNQTADITQFRYGTREGREAGRTLTGRMIGQFGNFSMWFHQYMSESLRNGTLQSNLHFLTWMGAITGALEYAKAQTGWNFSKWQFYNAEFFTGGPMVQTASDAATLARNVNRMVQGGQLSQQDYNETVGLPGKIIQDFTGRINPVGAVTRELSGLGTALTAPSPLQGFAQWATVGDTRTGPTQESRALGDYAATQLQNSVARPPVAESSILRAQPQPLPGTLPMFQHTPTARPLITAGHVTAALSGQPEALTMFSGDELRQLGLMRNLPPAQQAEAINAMRRAPTPGAGAQQ